MNALSSLSRLPEGAQTPLGADVYHGLTAPRKSLSPWLFYDAEGSRLFERITELDEYYLTRTERSILSREAEAILTAAGDERLRIIELGAGTATKTGLLLEAAVRRQGRVVYEPIDVSAAALEEATERIEEEIPGVTVLPRVADYTEGLRCDTEESGPDTPRERRMVLYIGSSIGNFDPDEAVQLLRDVREELSPGDCVLLGVDMVKPEAVLIPAYDDAQGVTAEFNRNVLRRINAELGADFDLDHFRHVARWNNSRSRIEMHLESMIEQQVSIAALDLEIGFRRGETIHTENSYKYTPTTVRKLLTNSGFVPAEQWHDDQMWFGVFLGIVA